MAGSPGLLSKLRGLASDVGKDIVDVGKDLVDTVSKIVGDDEFDHIRYLDQLGRQHQSQRKKISVQQIQEAEERADRFIQSLHPGYVQEGFDPVKYELEMLDEGSGAEAMDAVVEKLAGGVESVGGKLSRHVMSRKERLLEGIDCVAQTEDDLKNAFQIVRSTRSSLQLASKAMTQNMAVAGQTRRKQGYIVLIELCAKIKSIKDLQFSLKKAQEGGEYGQAILLCVQSFQEVDSLKELHVYNDLHASVQRRYVETLQRLDTSLSALCGRFDPLRYSKVLEAYMLQGVPGLLLAEKVMGGFTGFINDATLRVVRSMLLLKPKTTDLLTGSGGLEGSYMEMCRNMPVDLLRPCLLKLMDVIFDILSSYHVMSLWHTQALQLAQVPVPAAPGSSQDGQETEIVGAAGLTTAESVACEEIAEQAGISYLTSVAQALTTSRKEIFDLGTRRVMDLLNIPGLFKGEDFLQVVEWTMKYLSVGEAFVHGPLDELRNFVGATTSTFFDTYHRQNVETLEMLLENEEWKDIGKHSPASQVDMNSAIQHSPLFQPSYQDPDGVKDFGGWQEKGNPFKMQQPETTKRLKTKSKWGLGIKPKALAATAAAAIAGQADSSLESRKSGSGMAESKAAPTGRGSSSGNTETTGSGPAARTESEAEQAPALPPEPAMLTVSSQLMLKLFHQYGQLLQPLYVKAETILHAIFDMFDKYLLATFIYFSGVTMEVLVWQDDVLPVRLKTSLMRILTAKGSIYRAQIEELMRTRPATARIPDVPMGQASGIGFLDKFAAKMESIADNLERSAQRLGDRANTMPVPNDAASRGADGDVMSKSFASDPTNLHGLHERIVAAESLIHIASTLKGGKKALQAVLPPMLIPEMEDWFNPRGTIEASSEMQFTLFRGGARALLQPVLDPISGIAAQIGSTDYSLREAAQRQHRWADATSLAFQGFKGSMLKAQLPQVVKLQIWQHAIETGSKVIVEGMSRIRKCTIEGRTSLILDLAFVEKQLRTTVPEGFQVDLTAADKYCKAFNLPWEDLSRWCQVHLPLYGKRRVLALVELMADSHKIRKAARNDLVIRIEVFSQEFASTS